MLVTTNCHWCYQIIHVPVEIFNRRSFAFCRDVDEACADDGGFSTALSTEDILRLKNRTENRGKCLTRRIPHV